MDPYKETYDRRHLAKGPRVFELRDRSFQSATYDAQNLPVVRYENTVLMSVPTCGGWNCETRVRTLLGLTEQGVDLYVAPVPVAGGWVYVAPIPADQWVECSGCGAVLARGH